MGKVFSIAKARKLTSGDGACNTTELYALPRLYCSHQPLVPAVGKWKWVEPRADWGWYLVGKRNNRPPAAPHPLPPRLRYAENFMPFASPHSVGMQVHLWQHVTAPLGFYYYAG